MQTPEDLDRWLEQFPYEAAKERIKAIESELAKWRQWTNPYEASRHPDLLRDSSPSTNTVRVIDLKPTLRRAVTPILNQSKDDDIADNDIHARCVRLGCLRPGRTADT